MHLCRNTNHTTGGAGTSVAGLLGFFVSTLSKIISASVDDDSASKHTVFANELDEDILHHARSVSLSVSGNVS